MYIQMNIKTPPKKEGIIRKKIYTKDLILI